jgi:hypothetical protein
MTAREYLENKYPQMRGDKWNTHDVIDDNWVAQMMTEFAEMEVKNISSKPMLSDSLVAYQKWCYEHPEYD